MHTHNGHGAGGHEPEEEEIDTSLGYEASDVGVKGILVFMVSLGIFVVVTAFLCYGIGKVINAHLDREDGPTGKWSKTVDVRQLGNLPSSPELQNKMAELIKDFPTPRVQTDDGNQDIADLHAREDILLDNYTWVDQSKGKVRIPIERAMELIVQQGLPTVPAAAEGAQPMTGDGTETVTAPLTTGFARTGYEQELAESRTAQAMTEPAGK